MPNVFYIIQLIFLAIIIYLYYRLDQKIENLEKQIKYDNKSLGQKLSSLTQLISGQFR